MKRLIYYAFIMAVVIILIPLLVVNSCTVTVEEEPETVMPTPPQVQEVKITVFNTEREDVAEVDLEEYIKGVVAAEMPAAFEIEALKAQAVAARTYAYTRTLKDFNGKDELHHGADVCTDFAHCQAWISKDTAMQRWKEDQAQEYWSKIGSAVEETRGIIITYDDLIANPVFHSNSGGRTENAEDVWAGSPVPYLVSVTSRGEDECSEYENVVLLKAEDFKEKLKSQYSDFKASSTDIINDIQIVSYTTGGRVDKIRIGNITISGTELRRLFSLKSANFKIEDGGNNTLKITTIGNGHGVGMSQWGANYLAQNGETFREILEYYYNGIKLETIEEYQNCTQ